MTLLAHLYGQLEAIDDVDLDNAERVDAACKVNRAVNDTAKTIMGMVELTLRAYDARPGTVSADVVCGFFENGD